MPDLVMCTNKKCHRKNECYRHSAVPNVIQYYDSFKKIKNFDECPFFIEIEGRKTRSEYKNDSEDTPEPNN